MDNPLQLIVSVFFAALVSAAFAISFAAILYRGELATFLDEGIALTLLGTVVISLVGAVTLSYKGSILGPQDVPAILIASGAAGIISHSVIAPEAIFATIACLVALTSVATGVLGMTLGKLRLAHVMRFFPYPVLAGFLAATGFLLLRGGLELTLGDSYTGNFSDFWRAENIIRWVPAFVLATGIVALTRLFTGGFVMPVALIAALLGLYVFYAMLGYDMAALSAEGYLLGPFQPGGFLGSVNPGVVFEADWSVIATNTPLILTTAISALIGMTLNASGLELELKRDFDLNTEVKGGGLANLLSGLVGGIPGYHVVGETLLANRLGIKNALAGIAAGGGCALLLIFGGSVLNLLPVAFFASVIAFLGLDLLYSWLWLERRQLRLIDFAIVLIIPFTAVTLGFLTAIVLGLLLSAAIFIVEYSRLDIVRMESDLATRRSRVERPASTLQTLANARGQATILELSTYIFFGTSQALRAKVQRLLAEQEELRWIVLDFKRVPGLDVSAQNILTRIQGDCDAAGVKLILSGLRGESMTLLESDGAQFYFAATLAETIAEIEDEILRDANTDEAQTSEPADDLLTFLQDPALEALVQRRSYAPGALLIGQASSSRDIFVLLSGRLKVIAGHGSAQEVVLASILPGAAVGEMAYYTQSKRSAAIVAEESSELICLPSGHIEALEDKEPKLAATFHRLIARNLALRLNHSNAQLMALDG